VRFTQGTFSSLQQGDTVLGIPHRLVQAPDLGAELFRNGQSCGIIGGAGDAKSFRETAHGPGGALLQSFGCIDGKQSGNIRHDAHGVLPPAIRKKVGFPFPVKK
jgi:hypothetical protein